MKFYKNHTLKSFLNLPDVNEQTSSKRFDHAIFCAALFHYSNKQRTKNGEKGCRHHYLLTKSSILHSKEMRKHNFFNHTNPHNSKLKFLRNRLDIVCKGTRHSFQIGGENIADFPLSDKKTVVYIGPMKFKTKSPKDTYAELAKKVVDGWMNSPGHRKNILKSEFEFMGCGTCLYQNHNDIRIKITQNFGA